MELRRSFEEVEDLEIVWVMAERQINAKSLRFIDGLGLRRRVRFARDPDSIAIDTLGIRKPEPEPIEQGVPHPTTLLLDREGVVRFVDVRRNYHFWLAPERLHEALRELR